MELRVLKYFIKIAEEENMTKAAQKLHVSQPSKQMKELENEIGHLLFVRNKQRMVLTEKGMLLKKRAESILMLVDKTVDELNNDELLVGNIYIGTGQTDNLDEKFNKIVLYSMFPHLENKTNTIKKLIQNNLLEGGKLIIAHSDSREYLNNMHKNKDKIVSESRLIDINDQKKIFEDVGLKVEAAFEDDNIYYIVLKK